MVFFNEKAVYKAAGADSVEKIADAPFKMGRDYSPIGGIFVAFDERRDYCIVVDLLTKQSSFYVTR